jgi:surface protein
MFGSTANFDGDISTWDVSKVTTLASMFKAALKFDGDISNWVTTNVNDMSQMFYGAKNFDQGTCLTLTFTFLTIIDKFLFIFETTFISRHF